MSAGRMFALVVIATTAEVGCRGERARPATDGAAQVDAATHGPCPPAMVLVPGGGTDPVVDPVCISVLETTVAEYRRCVEAGQCPEPPGPHEGFDTYRAKGREDNPVVGISLEGAAAYCESIGGRLPRVSEWRWAFHSGSPARYPWGDVPDARTRICAPRGRGLQTGEGWPCPVGSHPDDLTAQGLLDMGGNAFELAEVDGPGDQEGWSAPIAWGNMPLFVPIEGETKLSSPDKTVMTVPAHRGKDEAAGVFGFRCAADPRGVPPTPRPPPPKPKPDQVYDECPAGLVEVPGREDAPALDRFCIGESEVTVGQYRKCVDAGSCTPPDDLESSQSTWRSGEDDLPLNFADFKEAIAYCEFIGARLPTLEEWVWAYRSGRDWALPWGDDLPPGTKVCQMPVPTVAPPRCPAKSHRIDRTAQGAYDMAGSLNELVRAPHEYLPGRSVFVPPPSRFPDGLTVVKDIRATYAPRSSAKNPDGGGGYDGFRCAATLRRQATTAQ